MSEPTPRLIVFDCDGTLVDSGHIIVDTMTLVWQGAGLVPPTPDQIRHQIGTSLDHAIGALHPDGDPEILQQLTLACRKAFVSDRAAGKYEEPLYDCCSGVLEALSEVDHYVLGVATGKGRRGLNHTLQRHGIAHHFSILKTSEDGPGKPHPEILINAMAEMGVSPWQTVVIGDTIFDVTMAVRAGAKAIGVSWGYHAPEMLKEAGASVIANHFAELPGLIENLWSTE
ncbi:HAD-IA family hydrolase [Hwanghaeella sp. LZ110]|uniref:HAD-IA family hydrolase n=1 Tax=Hwanghaeella sp. LZ110 TaxID=3402810 RepID=UPI003B6721EC